MSRTRNATRRNQQRKSIGMPLWLKVSLIVLLGAAAITLAYLAVIGVGSHNHPGIPVRSGALTTEQFVTSTPVPVVAGEIGGDMQEP